MIVNWADLTVGDLRDLSEAARGTCGLEITALTENIGLLTPEH
ncbi:MAG: hypothetical protein ACK5MU_04120 [Candidatus Saccharimonadales bacterium]